MQVIDLQPARLIHVLQQSPGRRDEDVHASQTFLLLL